jgi:single-strand DNA-binding protein
MNRTFHIGNLTRDPELRHTSSGKAIAEFGLAVKGPKDTTIFLDFTAWEKTAELVAKYKKKGEAIAVEGRLNVDTWQDKDTNKKRSKVVIVAENIEFLNSAKASTQENTTAIEKSTAVVEEEDSVPF